MRPTRDEYYLREAELVASRSTCIRRSVGCVLVDAHGRELAKGYNGVASGRSQGRPARLASSWTRVRPFTPNRTPFSISATPCWSIRST
jgi:hypothetical protein